ncbi:hypothetical protein PSTT_13743 [Puccinia striiformis]|uniref:Uncharacterized protein n=1 Tax=Puccinia striiformis TaxID=27350 RepID=A0A2S4UQG7_9BASI|nr:hypothetical protein PSTT_13743 [Puccinia striiformis]
MQFNRPTTLKKTSADTSIKAWKHPKSIEYSAGSMTTSTPYKHLKEKFEVWVFNDGLNKWLTNYNSFKRRYDPKRMLPTGCSANVCYKNPEEYDGEEGLIPVDLSCVDELEHEHYPDAEDLMRTSPGWFSEIMDRLKTEMESDHLFPNWGDDYSALLVAVGSSDWSLVA